MILKPLQFPVYISKLQALERRLPREHPKYKNVAEELAIQLAGYRGEKALEYPFSFLPEHYRIFFNIRLFNGSYHFQIDAIILTPQAILLIEAKNIAHEPVIDDNYQMIQRKNEQTVGSLSPIVQTQRHQTQLKLWMDKNNLPSIPLVSIVASSHPQTVLQSLDPELQRMICRTDALPEKIQSVLHPYKKVYSPEELSSLTSALLKADQPLIRDPLLYFKIRPAILLKGVACPSCHTLPLKRIYGTWECSYCKGRFKTAHIEAMKDYYFLFGSEINNPKLRQFLRVKSPDVAKRLLNSLPTRTVGRGKARKYYLKF